MSKEIAVSKNDIQARMSTGLVATTKVLASGWSAKLGLEVLWSKLQEKNPWCSIATLTREAARVRATEENQRKTRLRIPKFRMQLLDDGILLVTEKGSRGQIVAVVLFHKDADEHIVKLALKEIDERETSNDLSKDRADAMRKALNEASKLPPTPPEELAA